MLVVAAYFQLGRFGANARGGDQLSVYLCLLV